MESRNFTIRARRLCYLLALLPFVFQVAESEPFGGPICSGRVLTTLKDVYNMNKENCTTIEGPLFIEDLDPEGSKQLYSLDTVEQITQFLVVHRIRASYTCLNQLLPRLRVIRGHHLYENQWALVMRDNVHFFIDSVQRDMLKNSSRKLNKTFVPFVHNLLQRNESFYNISNFKEPVSNLCLESSRYMDLSGSCRQSCPDKTVVVEGWRCAENCGNLSVARFDWQMEKATVETVPGINSSQSALCLAPPVRCKAPLGVVREVNELRYIQECEVLEGNLHLSLTVSSVDMYFLEKYLGYLKEIKGYLLVFRSWGMDSLQFLSNLTKLNTAGELWQRRYALALYDNPDLSRLWEGVSSLTVSSKGAVYLQANPRLCSHDVEALNQSFAGRIDEDLVHYTSATGDLLELCENDTLCWDHMQSNMTVIGQFMYQTNLSNLASMSDQLCENTAFQQWMTDHGSPGDLKAWDVKEIGSNMTSVSINKHGKNQIYHIRVFGISGKHPELRSRVYFQPSKPEEENNSADEPLSCQDLPIASEQTFMISNYSNCCLPEINSNVTVHWMLQPDTFQVELEYKKLWEISWRSAAPFSGIRLNKMKGCFRRCPEIPKHASNEVIPREVSVVRSMPCNSTSRSVCSNNNSEILQDLEPYAEYTLRIRKRSKKDSNCDPWSPPVLIQTPPSEKADIALNLRVTHDDDHLTFLWNRPPHPNGGRVFYFCVAVRYMEVEFENATEYESGSCYASLNIDRKVQNSNRSWIVWRRNVHNTENSFTVKLHIVKRPKSEETIRVSVQTMSHVIWSNGRATTHLLYDVHRANTDDSPWIAGVTVCCVVILILIPFLIVTVRYGRGKRKEAFDLQNQIYYLSSYGDFSLDGAYKPDEWEVDAKCVVLHNVLGEGAFGKVYSGTLLDGKKELDVAVKTLKDGATPAERIVFLKESSMMKKLDSDNVVRLLGIVSKSDPVFVVMELMSNGDLKHYLQSTRPQEGRNEDSSYTCYPLIEDELVHMALQIAAGMHYLCSKRFVHRDLAARNCMVAANPKVIKVGDFGMARDVYSSDYYVKRGQGPMPIRWMAPESLRDGTFSYITDVWSYGVVLWEMVTLGSQPYPGKTNQEVFDLIVSGHGQLMDVKSLPHCPAVFMMLMERCWRIEPQQRPEFLQILAVLSLDHGEESKL